MAAPPRRRSPYYYIGSVAKAFRILDAFRGSRRTLSFAEIVEKGGMRKQDTHRFLLTLRDLGVVTQDPSKKFSIGRHLFEIGQQFVAARAGIDAAAEAHLYRLSDRTGCTSQVGILSGGLVTYVLVVPGTMPVQVVARVGHWRYAHASAIGKAILAFASKPLRECELHEDGGGMLKCVTERTLVTYEHLARDIELTIARGYSLSDGESSLEVAAVGAPIYDEQQNVIAGVSASFPRHAVSLFKVEAVAEEVTAAARRLSARMAS